ncbi:S-adenosyl-L-methionine-dependent methyltransferase [Xylariales sp. PMI_506]|nr:S-adenosyl-L-methionine-dependent methyltransferase [Xylariales sp. PMI_506]
MGDTVYSAYNKDQATTYTAARKGYHPNFYKRIADYHVSTGGHMGTLVDVGCGPGTSVNDFGLQFETAIGFDPSEGMIEVARQAGGVSGSGRPIRFERSTAEELGAGQGIVADGTVDMITAATAAHWFDMARFWPRAAQLMRPGGTVAIWVGYRLQIHSSTPNSEAITAFIRRIREEELEPYAEPGNAMVRDLYVDLPLPWTLAEPVPEFDESTYVRNEWTPLSASALDVDVSGQEFFLTNRREFTMDMYEKVMETTNHVTKWRSAHPDKAGTEEDVLKQMRRGIERLLHEAGVPEGQEIIRGAANAALLMVKKKKKQE